MGTKVNIDGDIVELPISFGSVLMVLVGVVILFSLLASVYIVNAGTNGVLVVLGQPKEILKPGVHLIPPFISNVYPMSTQTMKYEVDAAAASSDLQNVHSKIAVNYKLADNDNLQLYIFQQFMGAHEERIIAPLTQETVKATTAKYTANDLIQKRDSVKVGISDALKAKLLAYGIEVQEVSITNFDFSADFNNAIEQKVVVEQNMQKSQLELEQKKIEVQKLVAEQNATAQAQIIQADADKQTAILRAEGQAQATLINAQANQEAIQKVNSVLTKEYVQYQYSQRWDGALPTIVGNNGILLGMDMNQLNGSG